MKKILIINGGQIFGESKGRLNATITGWSKSYFEIRGHEVKITDINTDYSVADEIQRILWADVIIYHSPIWWFQVPYKLKEYLDMVFETGRGVLYTSDGRSRKRANPKLGYGTGGILQGRKYMVTTTWNAPLEAFTEAGELFYGKTPDDVLLGLHTAHKFLGIDKLKSFDFHDIIKEASVERIAAYEKEYMAHLAALDY